MNAETLMTQEQKARAYDALVAQLGVALANAPTVKPKRENIVNWDGSEDTITYAIVASKYYLAEAVRAALTHAQLVADEPPHSDDPEVETKRFETVEVTE